MADNETIEALREEVASLRAEVAQLRAQSIGSTRLGPRPETQAEIDARTARLTETIERIKDGNNPARMIEEQKEPPPVDRTKLCTTDGRTPAEVRAAQTNDTGQHRSYIVLCPDERAKGFVRPYRDAYKHVGTRGCLKPVPQGLGLSPLFCLMDAGHDGPCGSVFGPISKGCGTVTMMGRALSETYARDPKFYGATFCCSCNRHLPVSEFVWTADGLQVGS